MNRTLFSNHLQDVIIPFWKGMLDERGGYYGCCDEHLRVDRDSDKGILLHSRILWFFSNAYRTLGDPELLSCADHAFRFLTAYGIDREQGGVYWTVHADGSPADTQKHTYNQAFAIYALSSYYDASGDAKALEEAWNLFRLIESRCRDAEGYLEAFDRCFQPHGNELLSENGVEAGRTMNTLLHIMESYTEFYRVTGADEVRARLREALHLIGTRIYNPEKRRLEVFFDREYRPLIDLHSYGHDIEASWLIDRSLQILGDEEVARRMAPITDALLEETVRKGLHNGLYAECENGIDLKTRIWWVQAEAVLGLANYVRKHPENAEMKAALEEQTAFVFRYMVDPREGAEWYNELTDDLVPVSGMPYAGIWKCPYHNGRMAIEEGRKES